MHASKAQHTERPEHTIIGQLLCAASLHNHPSSPSSEARQKPSLHRHCPVSAVYVLSDSRRSRRSRSGVEAATLPRRVSPDYPHHLSGVPCPLPRRTKRVLMSIPFLVHAAFPVMQAGRRPHLHFRGACSSFTRVTARRIAQPPEAAFVTRLQPGRLPSEIARQLPDQSTTLCVEPSSTGDARLRGALHNPG